MSRYSSEDQENNSKMRRNPQERKEAYRGLLTKIEEIGETDSLTLKTVNELGEVLREANALDTEWNIDDRVEHADETYLDCLVLSSASSILKKCVNAVDVFTSTYDPSEYSNHIINSIRDDDELQSTDLLKLLDSARKIIPKVPDSTNVYGAYDLDKLPQPKPKTEKIKAVKEKVQKKEPEKVTNSNKEEESIEEIVKVLFEVLTSKYNENNENPIRYYDYIVDADDFAITVENMFYFSFLVRDGRASIDLNGEGEPVIKPIKKRALKEFREEGGVNPQILTQISMEQWEMMKMPGYLQQHKKNYSS